MASSPMMVVGTPTVSIQGQNLPRVGRMPRRPTHRFQLVTRPWQIQPFMVAPVLPGETLQNLLHQSRVVTDPLASKLTGWFKEYYYFFVPLRALASWSDLETMLLTGVAGPAATAASTADYYRGDGWNCVKECLDVVVAEFFRDDGEAVTVATIDGLPLAAIDVRDFTQSLVIDGATSTSDDELPGENPSLPAHLSSFSDHFAHFEAMRDMGLVAVDFEDWLNSMGVTAPQAVQEDEHKPELLRYSREWTYPSNTIDPSDGAASSACSWSVAFRADKKRFFREPGFVFGVTVTRPKVYKANLEAAGAHYLNNHLAWLPAVLAQTPFTSLREFSATDGPIAATATTGYWIDMRDLYIHGDQFRNFAASATDDNSVALPTAALEGDYPASGDADAMFANASPLNKIREDGRCDLRILSAHANIDHTPAGQIG